MKVNWFTVIAQIINFLILVWLLKRFLYKPVLNAIAERERKIASQLSDAETKKAEARRERDEFEQKNEAFDKARTAMMDQVQQQANAEKLRLFESVKKESNTLRSSYHTSLMEEAESVTNMLKRKAREEVFAIAEKTLSDLANTSLEEQSVAVFIEKINNLEEKENLKKALVNDNKIMFIKSAFELSPVSKSNIEKVVSDITEKEINFQYEFSPELVSGIEISTESYKLSWNIDTYLDTLKKDIMASLPVK